jgi:hypothetical protein
MAALSSTGTSTAAGVKQSLASRRETHIYSNAQNSMSPRDPRPLPFGTAWDDLGCFRLYVGRVLIVPDKSLAAFNKRQRVEPHV